MATTKKHNPYQSGVSRMNIYTLLENQHVKWQWDLKEIIHIRNLWKEGMNLYEIATETGENCDDVFLVLYDQAREGHIDKLNIVGVLG